MRTFHVKNWQQFQHYTDRSPPWIKLYNTLLDDYEFGRLHDASKLHLIAIWLLASRSNNKLPYDATWIARRINASDRVNLDALLKAGFIELDQPLQEAEQDASTPLAECLPREEGETEGESEKNPPMSPRKRGEADTPEFIVFWEAYPSKVGKGAARKAFTAAMRKTDLGAITAGLERYKRAKPPDREWCHPATFLNQERWADEPAPSNGAANGRNGASLQGYGFDGPRRVSEHRTPKSPPPTVDRRPLRDAEG